MQVTENTPQAQAAKPKRRRDILREQTQAARELVKAGEYPTVNAALLAMYRKADGLAEDTVFKLFSQWKARGHRVKKGSKGYPVWGAPKERKAPDGTTYEYYPVAYLFTNFQVENPQPKAANA